MNQKNETYLLFDIMHCFQYLEITLNYAFKILEEEFEDFKGFFLFFLFFINNDK